MEITKLFGLPAHPLLVHAPIVLIPLVSVGAIALAVVPAWRSRFGWLLVGGATAALVSVQLAISSGEGLEPHVQRSAALHRHTEMADSLRPLALLLLVVIVALVVLDRRRRSGGIPTWLPMAVGLVVIAASAITTARLVQIGHNGARASWGDVNMSKARGGGDG